MGGGINSSSLKELPTNINTIINGKKRFSIINMNHSIGQAPECGLYPKGIEKNIPINLDFDPSKVLIYIKPLSEKYGSWQTCILDSTLKYAMDNDEIPEKDFFIYNETRFSVTSVTRNNIKIRFEEDAIPRDHFDSEWTVTCIIAIE